MSKNKQSMKLDQTARRIRYLYDRLITCRDELQMLRSGDWRVGMVTHKRSGAFFRDVAVRQELNRRAQELLEHESTRLARELADAKCEHCGGSSPAVDCYGCGILICLSCAASGSSCEPECPGCRGE